MVQPGHTLLIYTIPGNVPTNGCFEVVAVNSVENTCDVKWPNGHVEKDVPIEAVEGQMSYITEDMYDQFFK